MTTDPRDLLKTYLQTHVPLEAARAIQKRTAHELVLEHAWFYEPTILNGKYRLGDVNQCFKNAIELTLEDERLIYCEGFALSPSGFAFLHGWVTDGKGNAIDNTLDEPAAAYAGIPFDPTFVSMSCLKNKATISLLGDWQNKFPLGNELADKQAEWLYYDGKGVAKVTDCN